MSNIITSDMKKSVILLIAALGILSAGAKTVTTSFSVNPGMGCQNCENKIKSNLRFEKGVKKITTSLSDQLVTITFDDEKTSNAKLIQAFKKAGYTAAPAKPGDKKAAPACDGNHKDCDGSHHKHGDACASKDSKGKK